MTEQDYVAAICRVELEVMNQLKASNITQDPFRLDGEKIMAAAIPEGFVLVKPQLESDVKAKMIGEYKVPVSSICPDCTGEGCCECNNTGTISQNVTIPWTTVKQIYRDGIFFMIQAAKEPT